MMISSSSSSLSTTIVVVIFLIANLYVFADAAELEMPLSGILGGDIDGVAANDNFGSAVATSTDGSRVVVGARNHDSGKGHVRVFEYGTSANPTGWSQLGGDIDGVAQSDNFGSAVAMSSDGNRIVVGAPYRDFSTETEMYPGMEHYSYTYTNTISDAGSVRVFEYGTSANLTGWSQLGGDIDGVAQSDNFGSAVAMSSDGNRIVIGAPYRDVLTETEMYPGMEHYSYTYTNTIYDVGSVRVFEYGTSANLTGWAQVGGDIDGVVSNSNSMYSGEGFGSAVAMSADGNRIVVGAFSTSYQADNTVRVYELGTSANPTNWTMMGSDIKLSGSTDYMYYSSGGNNIGASSDCTRVVVAFSASSYSSDKMVGMFEYGTTASPSDWSQIGTNMTGEGNEQFGSAVSMSADGDRVVIGARGGDVTGDAGNYFGKFYDVGFVRVMHYGTAANPSDWSQIGVDVFGEAQNDQFGSLVALSGDGNRVAVAAPNNDPSSQQAGHVRVLVTACVENAYVSDGACVACTLGSTNEAGDVLTQVDTVCDVAYCAAYEHVSNHTCVSCPVGSSNAPGDDPTGDDTDCDPLICGENYRVFSHGCLACETSVFNRAGDDASGDDTECDGSEAYSSSTTVKDGCAAYGHVVNHTCVLCPPGTMNAPGDDPTGDDTDCDPLICGENYRVFAHGCLACETDVFNRAGDDASGDDTKCDGSEAYSPGSSTRLFRADYDDSSARSFDVGAVVWFTAGTMCVMSLFP